MATNAFNQLEHIVVLILENRSFDHMLGYLYAEEKNRSPTGQEFDGLTGDKSCPNGKAGPVRVFRIDSGTPNAYFMPGADPGEGYNATNVQLFGSITAPASAPTAGGNQGFVNDFSYTMEWEQKKGNWKIEPGTSGASIMGMFTPEMLPVLSGLARGYAVCDQWFGSAPTETLPNRAFACSATSQGHMDDKTKSFTAPSIFGRLSEAGKSWSVYGYTTEPLTRHNFTDTTNADDAHFGLFSDFQAAAANGSLAAFTFLEPSWGENGNSQHPVGDVALGEQLIHDVYYALRNGPHWPQTLLIITYDEHGGCYDHVAPPWTATPPDNSVGEYGFDFRRFGPRVPAVLVSPFIAAGTVFRVEQDQTPLDHTAILKTVQERWGLAPLTARDKAACSVGAALTLAEARTDDPLAGIQVPASAGQNPLLGQPSHLQLVHAELVSSLPVPDAHGGARHVMPTFASGAECDSYIQQRTEAWKIARRRPEEA